MIIYADRKSYRNSTKLRIQGFATRVTSHEDSATCPLVLPLVGEFSSGKTTLINALTDNKLQAAVSQLSNQRL